MAALQDYTRLKRPAAPSPPSRPADLAWRLVLDSLVFAAEAEIRWLDHCEAGCAAPRSSGPAPRTRTAPPSRPSQQGGRPMTAVLQLDDVTRVHGRARPRCTPCAASPSPRTPASWSP